MQPQDNPARVLLGLHGDSTELVFFQIKETKGFIHFEIIAS